MKTSQLLPDVYTKSKKEKEKEKKKKVNKKNNSPLFFSRPQSC
jgi:hypothetical protein